MPHHSVPALPLAVKKATADDLKALVDKVDCFIFDCDGELLVGGTDLSCMLSRSDQWCR